VSRAGVAAAIGRASLLAVLAGPLACSSVLSSQVVQTGPSAPPRAPDAPVALFFSNVGLPASPYVEIARIRVESTSSLPEVLGEAQARARQMGADAIIVDLRYHYQSLPVTFDAAGAPHVPETPKLNANATAIRYVPGS
jgi:hypothetical protein